jgi:hypothetical protein
MDRPLKSYIEIVFAGVSATGKTDIWIVRNKFNSTPIGYVRWAGNWRKYVYEQEGSIYYDWNCLREIADFIERVTHEHAAGVRPKL